ncbi:coniferyl alcohol acyltransferase-like [Humulus lupulus]|uniref:coniferyl alcohol acyltransferase-like n=1 Tax=Humulus lupulus TaxID=3486 RepID=UPI002B414CED|nr:coniferyl alcohol acyltransferase-like [Humulus lupulus]
MGLGDEEAKQFLVTIKKEEVVAPLRSTPLAQEHWLPMSNLDLLFSSKTDVASILCYKKPKSSQPNFNGHSLIVSLKKSLAQVLVPFFPLAGELVHNSLGEPEIWCNNRGVDFIEAYADVELEKLNLYNLDESFVIGKLVPEKKRGILAVQATELKCGSMVVVCLFDHRCLDGYSGSMFITSWAEFTRSKPLIYNRPSLRRSILNPHRLGCIDTTVQDMYVHKETPETPSLSILNNDHPILSSRLYYIKAEHIKNLQIQASSNNNNNITKFESFSAFLWKMIAKSSSASNVKKLCRMGFFVDGRKLLAGGEGEDNMMKFYIGNVLSTPFWGKKICDLNKEPLNQVAREVHECLETILTKEHFLGILDWVEALRPKPGMFRISSFERDDGLNFIMSSGLRLLYGEGDFGWGKPILWSAHFPSGFQEIAKGGYVMPMLNPNGNGDWVVYMHLHMSQLEFIEKEASNILVPLTFDHLEKIHYTNINSKI